MNIPWIIVFTSGCLLITKYQIVIAESNVASENQVPNVELDQWIATEPSFPRLDKRHEDERQEETTLHDDMRKIEIEDQLRHALIEPETETTEDSLPVWEEAFKEPDSGLPQSDRDIVFEDINIHQEIMETKEINNENPVMVESRNETGDQNKSKLKIDLSDKIDVENQVQPLKISSQFHTSTVSENDYDTRVEFFEDRLAEDDEFRHEKSSNEVVTLVTQTIKNKTHSSTTPKNTRKTTENTPKTITTLKHTSSTPLTSIFDKKIQKTTNQLQIQTTTDLYEYVTSPSESYIIIVLDLNWSNLCTHEIKLRATIAAQLSTIIDQLTQPSQIVFLTTNRRTSQVENSLGRLNILCLHSEKSSLDSPINVMAYVESSTGRPDTDLTVSLGHALSNQQIKLMGSAFQNVIMEIHFFPKEKGKEVDVVDNQEYNYTGIVAAFTISGIAGTSLLLLCVLLLVLRFRHVKYRKDARRRAIFDTYSLDSISIYSSIRRNRSSINKRSYLNLGFTDPCGPSHKINFAGLANLCIAHEAVMEEEFQSIPNDNVKLIDQEKEKLNHHDLSQTGHCENNSRAISKITSPTTRHFFITSNSNVNFIRGHKDKPNAYLTCRTPQTETAQHFWKMVWDQEIRVIVMLVGPEQDNFTKCATYFPNSETDSHKLFGDYQISLKSQETLQHYTVSRLQIRDLEKNLMRDVCHFWYTSWTSKQMPTNLRSVLALLLEARAFISIKNSRPLLIHCSNGVEQSGTVVAIDLCMRQFEESRTVDIPFTVYTTRKQCIGAIRSFQHYAFIYQVLNEYATRLEKPSLVRCDTLTAMKRSYNHLIS